jgi:DNA primase catalytic subunit
MFITDAELRRFIARNNPSDCYVSVAFYDNSFAMEGWRGAELFFDLDCEENIKMARADAETVYEVLLDDFALKEVELRFSGAKGYHLLVHDKEPQCLRTQARKEIVDYMVGKYGVKTIDAPASCDVKRLRRIAGTVNSKTGKFCEIVKWRK